MREADATMPRGLLEGRRVQLGTVEQLAPGREATVVDVTGDSEAARTVSVTLTLEPIFPIDDDEEVGPDDLPQDGLSALALIEWGVSGHRPKATLDCLRGCVFAVACASLRVVVRNTGSGPVRVGGFVGYGGADERAFLSVRGPSLAADEAWTFEPPAFSQYVEVLRPQPGSFDVQAFYGRRRPRETASPAYSQRVRDFEAMGRLPLANGVAQLRVRNRGDARLRPLALFSLAL